MKHRENRDLSGSHNIEDEVGKSRYDCAPHIAIDDRARLGKVSDSFEPLPHCLQELFAEIRFLRLIPIIDRIECRARLVAE